MVETSGGPAQTKNTDYRPRQAPDAVSTVVDGHAVILAPKFERAVLLDPVSSHLWSWMDGTVSVDEFAHDLVDADPDDGILPEHIEAARGHLDYLVDMLGKHGLLDDVDPPIDPARFVQPPALVPDS